MATRNHNNRKRTRGRNFKYINKDIVKVVKKAYKTKSGETKNRYTIIKEGKLVIAETDIVVYRKKTKWLLVPVEDGDNPHEIKVKIPDGYEKVYTIPEGTIINEIHKGEYRVDNT